MRKFIAILLLVCVMPLSWAGRGPTHKSLRAYAMGNAFVAVAEDKDAVYYNPAGLNLINKLGNYKTNPELGYYVHNFIDMRLNLGLDLPMTEAMEAYRIGRKFQKIYQNAMKTADGKTVLMDSLGAHPELADEIVRFDLLPINISTKFDAEMALPHFGGAIWIDGSIAPYVDGGIITPAAGVDTVYIDAVMQGAMGFSLGEYWSWGIGYKMVKREYISDLSVSLLEWESAKDTLMRETDRIKDNASKIQTIGHAIEGGILYQWKRDVRLGASLRNWFIDDLGNENITPNLTAGIAYSPRRLQRNHGFFRKVNLAMDFEDMLNSERNYKFFSHLNFGCEIEQVLLAISNWPSLRFLKVRTSLGFKGGYPTAGFAVEALRFAEIEFTTWAEEAGYFTGAEENRFWVVQLSLGI